MSGHESGSLPFVPYVLIATDSQRVANEVAAVLPAPEFEFVVVDNGASVSRLAKEQTPDLVITDLQVGTMGGMAICLDLRLEASGGRLPEIPILQLLDRRADVFLARRGGAQGWVIKPLDPLRLRKAIRSILSGGTYEDSSYIPNPVVV